MSAQNSLINCAIYHARQTHYDRLEKAGNAFTTSWRNDELRCRWKTYRCNTIYPELCFILKENPHYKALAAQSAQQALKTVSESIASYNYEGGFVLQRRSTETITAEIP